MSACTHHTITAWCIHNILLSILCTDVLSVCNLTLYVLVYRYVHIGESHRGYLGTGSVDFAAFFRALAKYDYKEAITFESFSSAVVSGSLSNTLCVWRNL